MSIKLLAAVCGATQVEIYKPIAALIIMGAVVRYYWATLHLIPIKAFVRVLKFQ